MNVKIARIYLAIQNDGYISITLLQNHKYFCKCKLFMKIQRHSTYITSLLNSLLLLLFVVEAFILHPEALYRNTKDFTIQFITINSYLITHTHTHTHIDRAYSKTYNNILR